MKIGDKYIIPSGTKLWFIDLQQSLITTKKYIVEVTHTIHFNDSAFFGDLYETIFEGSYYEGVSLEGLMKLIHGEVSCDSSLLKPYIK